MKETRKRQAYLVLFAIVLVVIVLIVLFIRLFFTVFKENEPLVETEESSTPLMYSREGKYSNIVTLPAGRFFASSETDPYINVGVKVLFKFPNNDEDSYHIEKKADNEVHFTNNSSGAVLQMRLVNYVGVSGDLAMLAKNLPDLKPYDWDGFSVYEWTEHGDNRNFYLHYFFVSKNKAYGWGYELVAAMEYTEGAITDYEWGKEIFRKVKIEEVIIGE